MAGDHASAGLRWLGPGRLAGVVARWRSEHPDGLVVRLAGERAADRETFFDEAATALALPPWFGRNWDALYDALTDLGRLGRPAWLLVVTDADRLLRDTPDEREVLLAILADAAAWSAGSGGPPGLTTLLVTGEGPAT